ncbi:hypothetical protein AA313_de0210170 [Arthrobotrys entomopaga]|nr:hypothetical protein AA313_de0210170 [Arthrobotrys entomopaga]
MANQLNRRISISDIETPEAPISSSSRSSGPLPPTYLEYKPGGREEFFKDLEAYQAAAQIYLQHKTAAAAAAAASNSSSGAAAPSYDTIGEVSLITIHETKIFRKRILTTLREIRNFIERRRLSPKWSNCFGMAESIRFILAAALAVGLIAGIAIMAVLFRQAAGLVALTIFLIVHMGNMFYLIQSHRKKSRLIKALQVGLAKVEAFERIDDENLALIKGGINRTLNPLFWIQSERRMEEAIPDEARVVVPPPPLEDGMEMGVLGYNGMPPPVHPLYTDTAHGAAPTALEMLAPRLPPAARRRSIPTPPPPSITPPPPSITPPPPPPPPIATTTTLETHSVTPPPPPPGTMTPPIGDTVESPISSPTPTTATEILSVTPSRSTATPQIDIEITRSATPSSPTCYYYSTLEYQTMSSSYESPASEQVSESIIPPPPISAPSTQPTSSPPPPPPPPVEVTNETRAT